MDYRHVEIEPNGEVATLFENDGLEVCLELLNAPPAGFQGAFGLQLEDQSFSAVGEEALSSLSIVKPPPLLPTKLGPWEKGSLS